MNSQHQVQYKYIKDNRINICVQLIQKCTNIHNIIIIRLNECDKAKINYNKY